MCASLHLLLYAQNLQVNLSVRVVKRIISLTDVHFMFVIAVNDCLCGYLSRLTMLMVYVKIYCFVGQKDSRLLVLLLLNGVV